VCGTRLAGSGCGLHALQHFLGDHQVLARGQGVVEGLVVQVVVAKSAPKIVIAVAREFARARILKPTLRSIAHQGERQHGQDQRDAQLQAAPRKTIGRPQRLLPQGAPDERANACGEHGQARQDPAHGVGLANIAQHLARVDQVVHGDEIEPHAKFVPEHELGGRHKNRTKERQHKEDHEAQGVNSPPSPTRRAHPSPEGEDGPHIGERRQVIPQPHGKHAQPAAQAQARPLAGEEDHPQAHRRIEQQEDRTEAKHAQQTMGRGYLG